MITNLRMDPYERGMKEGGGAMDFLGRQMWLLVPVQGKIKEFFSDFEQYPYQVGQLAQRRGINYGLLQQQQALKRLKDLEGMKPRRIPVSRRRPPRRRPSALASSRHASPDILSLCHRRISPGDPARLP